MKKEETRDFLKYLAVKVSYLERTNPTVSRPLRTILQELGWELERIEKETVA